MTNPNAYTPQPRTPNKSALTAVAEIAVILLALSFVGKSTLEIVRASAATVASPRATHMQSSSYANVTGAHFLFTNTDAFPKYACVRGVLQSKQGQKLVSLPVCTGEVKPFSSVELTSHFPGSVEEVCSKEGRFGRELDWDACTFDAEDVTGKPNG